MSDMDFQSALSFHTAKMKEVSKKLNDAVDGKSNCDMRVLAAEQEKAIAEFKDFLNDYRDNLGEGVYNALLDEVNKIRPLYSDQDDEENFEF